MKVVRSDVKKKLFDKLTECRKVNPQQCVCHYHTNKAVHYISYYDGVYYYLTIGYDGMRYYSVEEAIQ